MIEGASGLAPAPRAPVLAGEEALGPRRHLGPTGKPCVAVNGFARPEPINPQIFEHVITANNSCSQVIKLTVCYYGSDRCTPLTVASYARKETVLGILPAMKEFRFEYREQFP